MLLRPKHETVESLCSILRRLENTPDPAQDAGALADLKQILRNRIAVLEAQEALASKSHDDESTDRAA